MAKYPIGDRAGNVLIGVREIVEPDLLELDRVVGIPASLVVVVHRATVLLILDGRRQQWELPGGTRETGESPGDTARRELAEETGIRAAALSLAAVATFRLAEPRRQEVLAVYRVDLPSIPLLTVNEEALAFRWWAPSDPVSPDMSPLDTEIARQVAAESLT